MSGKITLVPVNNGLTTNRTAFNIADDAFPQLINAYQWRGRVKRKRGTENLTRLQRSISSVTLTATGVSVDTTVLLFADTALAISTTQPNASIVPRTLVVTFDTATFTDTLGTGILTVTGTNGVSGTINYATGSLNLIITTYTVPIAIVVTFDYYPTLPVMGLEQIQVAESQFPGTIAFDTIYSYRIDTLFPFESKDVSYYKNPIVGPSYPSYTAKTTSTSLVWNGEDYQQFGTVNYQGALWTINGMNLPFDAANIGMQFKPIATVTVNTTTTCAIKIVGHGLVTGDFLFINEVVTTDGINLQTGYVVDPPIDVDNVNVKFPYATIATNGTDGIAQYLTSNAIPNKDCTRWYDGDPTVGAGTGWVNFCPPLSLDDYVVSDNPSAIYYLVGARLITTFKDRLVFLGPVIQTSSGTPVYLQDTIIYSQNGTPYYTCSYTNLPNSLPTNTNTVFHPILVPVNQTAISPAFFEDQNGFGGSIQAGIDSPIVTVASNQDVLIVGFSNIQARFVYTGNDLLPFEFYTINSEYGSQGSFSAINTDRGVISCGTNGFILTAQTGAQRIDTAIPDQVFTFNLTDNGSERICSQRDFVNEWIYFTYVDSGMDTNFPNQTMLFNYRDNTWAIFKESYTTYGTFREETGVTWGTLPSTLTWATWTTPWNSPANTLLQPDVIAGNAQGFVVKRISVLSEAQSLAISDIVGDIVTSPNHNLQIGDYFIVIGALGTVGASVNNKIFSVGSPMTKDSFSLNPKIPTGLTYLGLGVIQRMYVPLIQSKQFNPAWSVGRKTRIGVQQYLFSKTNKGQVTLNIYLSQDAQTPWNSDITNPPPNSLVYSQIVYTCPESTNLGLTPANTNLQMPTANTQSQIWHRMNTSMIGDTIQFGITLSDAQMRDPTMSNQMTEIEFHGAIINISASSLLA